MAIKVTKLGVGMATALQKNSTASCNLQGRLLVGHQADREWEVLDLLSVKEDETPGQFSVTYRVRAKDGTMAFLKASDIGMFAQGADFLTRLVIAASAQKFEREILDHCRGNNMDRVVTAIDYGDFETTHEGIRDRVFFIVFELAEGDLRRHVNVDSQPSLSWMLTALKNFFVGIQQLHSGEVCHNDFKPANALVFDDNLHKVADLGRATSLLIRAPHEGALCAGDVRYAPPEQLYAMDRVTDQYSPFDQRRVGDLYSLGSMIHYMLARRMVTPEVIQSLPIEHKPQRLHGGWQESFASVLPFWRLSFDNLINQLREECAEAEDRRLATIYQPLITMVIELCEPDPRLRGHARNRGPNQDAFGLARYVTQFDLLARRAALLDNAKLITR